VCLGEAAAAMMMMKLLMLGASRNCATATCGHDVIPVPALDMGTLPQLHAQCLCLCSELPPSLVQAPPLFRGYLVSRTRYIITPTACLKIYASVVLKS
jgi:hypothetical protein